MKCRRTSSTWQENPWLVWPAKCRRMKLILQSWLGDHVLRAQVSRCYAGTARFFVCIPRSATSRESDGNAMFSYMTRSLPSCWKKTHFWPLPRYYRSWIVSWLKSYSQGHGEWKTVLTIAMRIGVANAPASCITPYSYICRKSIAYASHAWIKTMQSQFANAKTPGKQRKDAGEFQPFLYSPQVLAAWHMTVSAV